MNKFKSKKMKKLLLILVVLMFSLLSFSQERNDVLDSSYVASTTDTINYDFDGYYQGAVYYDGVVGFQFTIVNYTDSLNHLYLMGSYDGVNMILVDSLTTLTAGNYALIDVSPVYLKYYLFANAATGDTATVKNITYFSKKTLK